MKGMRRGKRSWWKSRGFSRKSETGYVLTWVMILMIVSGLIIGPFLGFMLTGLRASYSYADTMALFYAADSGIEDATYKIQAEYSATTTLDGNIDDIQTTITVTSTALFPESGVIQIGTELINYGGKTGTDFTGCTRGFSGTTAANHSDGALVTASLPDPQDVNDSWQYSIEDINGKEVAVTIESQWILDGLESDVNGTTPHDELVLVGQMLDTPATVLSQDINDTVTTIPVSSTGLFPTASADDPSIIRIEDELIQYTGKTDTTFTGCTRGINGTTAASHTQDTAVTSEEVTYRVDITYDGSMGNLKIDKVGAWLPTGFSYVPGSSNVATTLRSGIFSTATQIPVESVDPFPTVDADNPGVVAIEHELIQYTGTQGGANPKLTGCTRGYGGTTAADHAVDTPVSAEPVQTEHHGGAAVYWLFNNINFEDLPTAAPVGGEGGFTPSVEFPTRRTITFSFSPAGVPKGLFSWIRTNRNDIYLSWDTSSGTYKITATATDPSTGNHTTLESYVGRSQLTGRVSGIQGNARAIGNSLMKDLSGDYRIRETLLAESSASVSDIPEDAEVETAYLYWSGWKLNPAYDENDIQGMADLVDEAAFNGAPITADRVQILENSYGWSYSAFKDVTSYLQPEQTAAITLSASMTAESVTITNEWWSDSRIQIDANADNPGDMSVDGTTISPGQSKKIWVSSSVELSAGTTQGQYNATISVTKWYYTVSVDGTVIGGWWNPDSTDVTLSTTQTLPEATMTKISGASAEVDITNNTPNEPPDPDNNITVDGDTVVPGETKSYGPYITGTPHTISGANPAGTYEVTITCTKGIIKVDYGSNSVVLGEPGTLMTNGTYTVGDVNADPGQEVWPYISGQWAYAGWSLIIMYSSPSEEPHQLYLYDNFLYADVGDTQTFTVTGFRAPDDSEGVLTAFVGEGDEHYDGDYIEFNGSRLPVPGDPYDNPPGLNPQDNVWNSKSSGLGGLEIDGVDIDTFDVSTLIDEGDTSAVVEMGTPNEIWNLVYLFLSFRSDIVAESGESQVGVITYSYGVE
jgi:hypothetical protein